MTDIFEEFEDVRHSDVVREVAALREEVVSLRSAATRAVVRGSADDLRRKGWMVAVHNDYRMAGEVFTFWLFTKDGLAVKGEGRTDGEALDNVRIQVMSME